MALQRQGSLKIYDPLWVAGLYEAEGSTKDALTKSKARFTVCMKDFATVRHISALLGGIGTFSMAYINRKNPKRNNQLSWSLDRYEHQCYFVPLVAPYLFANRFSRLSDFFDVGEYTEPEPTLPWMVGYMEGEGCFNNSGRKPLVVVESSDYDVLDAVERFFNCGRQYGPYNRKNNIISGKYTRDNAKPTKQWRARGEPAIEIMREFYPMLSQRRQFQIDYALNKCDIRNRPNYRTLVSEEVA